MGRIRIAPQGTVLVYEEGRRLMDILQDGGLGLESPCGGRGTCGKCRVRIMQGEAGAIAEEEQRHLGEAIQEGWRLSCLVYPKGDLEIMLPEGETEKHRVLADGYIPEFSLDTTIHKAVVPLMAATLENNISYEEILENSLGCSVRIDDPHFLDALGRACRDGEGTVVYAGKTLIGIEPGNTADQLYGAAIDIGTTTVVLSLVDLRTGRELGSETCINPQKEYGLDVLSRIEFAKRRDEGTTILQQSIVQGLNELLGKVCAAHHVRREQVYEFTVGANATMMHLLLGISPVSIGKSPYVPVFSRGKYLSAHTIGLQGAAFARLYCLPGVSSYIGADIVAGAAVAGLETTKDNVLFLDIGTNCEMILSKRGELTACSCAAGPALEGANISCGMRAADGAIEGLQITGDDVTTAVIGAGAPVGICGSGILEAISEIWSQGIINKAGRLKKQSDLQAEGRPDLAARILEENKKRRFVICREPHAISITQADIRQVQLAKGAISSGLYALLELMHMDMAELDRVVIAGQFGRHLKVDSLTGTGIIPAALRDRIDYIGNSSRTGALLCLLSQPARQNMERIAGQIHYFELSTKAEYEKLFTKCLSFS